MSYKFVSRHKLKISFPPWEGLREVFLNGKDDYWKHEILEYNYQASVTELLVLVILILPIARDCQNQMII